MEQVIIQDCGCIALPESIAMALDLRRGMTLDVTLTSTGDGVLLIPHASQTTADNTHAQTIPASNCVILPPSR